MSTATAVDRLRDFAELLGCAVRAHHASTGSVYLTLDHEFAESEFVVRVSDHGDAYERAAISVDPQGLTVAQAQAAIAKHFGFPSPAKCRAAARQWQYAEELERVRWVVAHLHPGSDKAAFVAERLGWARDASERRAWAAVAAEIV